MWAGTRALITTIVLTLPMAPAAWSGAPAGGLLVDDFELSDQHGQSHSLTQYRDSKAIVLMVQGNGCPIVRNALADIKAVREAYRDRQVTFLMINANLQDDAATIAGEAEEFAIDFPILVDEDQQVGTALELDRTAEVLLIEPGSWRVVYRGPVNDRLDYERQARVAREHYLADAIDSLLAGQQPAVPWRRTKGCLIYFPERESGARASS